ncbi:MAG: DUF86 domain-containing protein [Actinomycetota bacterium]|jgi:uncharacterized protein YutE (UPF0331/DUF86 family)|nr:DUF86 domain-containing protein [Actinomycetota bacterium]
MIDTSRVRARLALLARYRRRLAGLRDLPRDSYLRDHDLEGRYALQAAAQICIDLANHVIVANAWEPARDFRDSFTRLEEHGLLDGGLAERLRALAGQRNRLVHLYDDVDDSLVQDNLATGLDDLDDFARVIAGLAGREPSP